MSYFRTGNSKIIWQKKQYNKDVSVAYNCYAVLKRSIEISKQILTKDPE